MLTEIGFTTLKPCNIELSASNRCSILTIEKIKRIGQLDLSGERTKQKD